MEIASVLQNNIYSRLSAGSYCQIYVTEDDGDNDDKEIYTCAAFNSTKDD